jgi:hypothetical protein
VTGVTHYRELIKSTDRVCVMKVVPAGPERYDSDWVEPTRASRIDGRRGFVLMEV